MTILCNHQQELGSGCERCAREMESRAMAARLAAVWAEAYLTALDDVKFGKVTENPFQENEQ